MTLVIAACTHRKRKPVSGSLQVAALPKANLRDLAQQWVRRLALEPVRYAGEEIYGGRSFREAAIAAKLFDAKLVVVSAGLGLIEISTLVPAYACTVLPKAPDSVQSRVTGDFSVSRWWEALCEASPFAIEMKSAVRDSSGPICAALSETYIELIAADLLALPEPSLGRLRLFTRAPLGRIPEDLRPFVMPYDDRLDGPNSSYRGTRSDFAGRALRHYAELTRRKPQGRSASEDAALVATALEGWRMPAKVRRTRLDDAALLDLIRAHWNAERGSSSRLLRRIRDDLGVACEQHRFAKLARVVRSEYA